MAVLAASFNEGPTILHVALAGIDQTLLAVAGHAVAFKIPQMRVDRPWR